MTGFVNIIKPSGMSSAAAVAKVRHALNVECGHMGTLDPMAEGVLPIALGKTCRLFDYLLDKVKTYQADFKFGYLTDTLDKTGKVVCADERIPTLDEIKSVLPRFVGEVMQVPPKYSAKYVDGKRSYKLAREGVEFSLEAKKVNIHSLDVINYENGLLTIKITCGGGTYVRSLGRDIAEALDTVATMEKLVRTKSGIFEIEKGINAREFEKCAEPEKYIMRSDEPLLFEKVELDEENAYRIKNGLPRWSKLPVGLYSVYAKDEFIGIGEVKDGLLKIKTFVFETYNK